MEYENNDKKIESVFSSKIRAGKRRTYFFDVRATKANDYFLTITESRKRFDNNGYDRHKVFIYKEDFNKFIKAITEAIDFVKTELMPDFDFDAFNHEESAYPGETNEGGLNVNSDQQKADTPLEVKADTHEEPTIDEPITITEKKPLEARDSAASAGDNMSDEEVDKW